MRRLTINALGTPVALVGDAQSLSEIARDWSRCLVPNGPSPQMELQVKSPDSGMRASVPWLASRVTRAGIEALAGRRLLFHACGVADDRGRTLIMVGPSGAGKSTAAGSLCRAAFGYVSDETIAVTEDFAITPYPKPLLIPGNGSQPKTVVGPDALSLRACPPSVTASRVVLIHRDGTAPAVLDRAPLAEAVLALVPETSALARLETPLQDLCRLMDHCGGAYRLRYAEIADAAGLLAGLLESDVTSSDHWEPIPAEPRVRRSGRGGSSLPVSRIHDGVVIGDQVLLLRDGRPIHLRGIGSTLWLALSKGHAEGDLVATVVDAHGPHAQAHRLVAEAIEELEALGLLERLPAAGPDD